MDVAFNSLLSKLILYCLIQHLLKAEKEAEKTIKEFSHIESIEAWETKFSHFKKDVEHHAKEEEEKLFPKVEKLLDEEELEAIGKEMREFKDKSNN